MVFVTRFQDSCVVELPEAVLDLVRPPIDCSMCEDLYEVDRVAGNTTIHTCKTLSPIHTRDELEFVPN